MPNEKNKYIKEVIEQLIISFFYISLIFIIVHTLFSNKINNYINILNMLSVKSEDIKYPSVSFDKLSKRLKDYPLWGSEFGTLEIRSQNIKLPIYQGDELDILKHGVGHFSGSLFPGEGGSIIFAAHNNKGYLYNLPNVKINDEIVVSTTYGTFKYQVYETKIIDAKDNDAFLFYDDREILMIYTCYPVNTIGHKTHRFLVYAKKVGESFEK